MEIYQLPKQPFTSTGSQLEDKLSNSFSNEVDLLVRESIQNSLDASDESSEEPFVRVDYYIKKFNDKDLLKYLSSFNIRENDKKYDKSLIIKDTGTIGVDGDPEKTSSSYYRLLFDSNNPQSKASSGGSSGEGKTLYFKLGIGLVIYYTSIKIGDEYESRLNISYLENEKEPLKRLPNSNDDSYTGICWWGEKNNTSESVSPILPVTDKNFIKEILDVFDVSPFEDKQTGTMVIIPFFKDSELIDVNSNYGWTRNIQNYLMHSVQKWYCFRLDNSKYPFGKFLRVYVNDQKVSVKYEFFKYLKKLYSSIYSDSESSIGILKEIKLNKIDEKTGTLSYLIVKKSLVDNPDGINQPTPSEILFNSCNEKKEDVPYVVYTRSLGMVINYTDPPFNNHRVQIPSDSYLIGVFSLNGKASLDKEMYNKKVKNISNLEEYYRKMETSTHEKWEDKRVLGYIKPFTFTRRIFNKIHGYINDSLTIDTKSRKSIDIDHKLASKVGNAFMPNIGLSHMSNVQFGTGSSGGTGGTGEPPTKKKKGKGRFPVHHNKSSISFTKGIIPLVYTVEGSIRSNNTVSIVKNAKKVLISIDLSSTQTNNPLQNYKEWESDYPVEILKLEVKNSDRDRYENLQINTRYEIEEDCSLIYNKYQIEISNQKAKNFELDIIIEYIVKGIYETNITLMEEC